MKATLTLALATVVLGGCAIVPYGYDAGPYRGYYRDRDYRGDRFDGDRYDRHGGWRRDDERRGYYGGYHFRYRDYGQ